MNNATAVLIIEWQQQALSHHRLRDDMEISSVQRRIHREAARIYTECVDDLLTMVQLVNEMQEEQDEKEAEG